MKQSKTMHSRSFGLVISICFCLSSHDWAAAQGVIVSLNTGQGQTLVTEQRTLLVSGSQGPPSLAFNFGFATEETVQPGTLLDSFTVTLQSANQLSTAIYLTIDASGQVLAPLSAGTVQLDPSSIQTIPIAYPSLQPVLPARSAFQVSAAIPSQFNGQSVKVFFDLFDNLDSRASQAWFSDLRIVEVPEPSPAALIVLALLLGWATSKRSR
jgi:hypothetical protein